MAAIMGSHRTLVFALAWGYPSQVYRVYLESLRIAARYRGDVAFLVGGNVSGALLDVALADGHTRIVPFDRSSISAPPGRQTRNPRKPNPSIQRFRLYKQV